MHADLVGLKLRLDVESLMVHKVTSAVRVDQLRVVSGSSLSDLIKQTVVSDQLDAVIVELLRIVRSIVPCGIQIRTGRIFGAEQAHVIAALCCKSAVCHIHKIIPCFGIILNVRTFARCMHAARQMYTKVAVDIVSGHFIYTVHAGIDRLAGRGIELQKVDAARP